MTTMDCIAAAEATAENDASLSNECQKQPLDTVLVCHDDRELSPQQEPIIRSCLKNSKSSASSSSKKSSNVAFFELITVTECLHYLDYSKKEFKGTWFTPKENAQSREDYRAVLEHAARVNRSLAAHLESSSSSSAAAAAAAASKSDLFCTRGLEYKTPLGCKRREQNKRAGWEAVEHEQYRQWDQGFKDEEALAEEYHVATHHCVQQAILTARDDRLAVLNHQAADVVGAGGSSLTSTSEAPSTSAHSRSSSSVSSSASSSPLFATGKKHHSAAMSGGRRPVRSQGRVSRAA